LVVYFLPRLFDFFSCPEFPFFLVICFLEFLLFVVVYFLPRLSDFDFYVHKEADERPSPFFLLFFLRLLLSKQTDERPSVRGTQAASGAARHVLAGTGRPQSVGSGQAVPTPH